MPNNPAYTKENIGIIERVNLTIINKARSLLFHLNSPLYLWGEAVLTASYLYNRSPHKALAGTTPYSNAIRKNQIFQISRVFGSLAFYQIKTSLINLIKEPKSVLSLYR